MLSVMVLFFLWVYNSVNVYNSSHNIENFENYNLLEVSKSNNYPSSVSTVLLQDSYPITRKNGVSGKGENQIWQHYPIFKVGSYLQITNNFKHQRNPDIANCISDEFCGTLYKNKQVASNIINQLPPANDTQGRRISFFTTNIKLL
jgi:hypothetical protein